MSSFIIIIYDNFIYKIEKEPYESDVNTYKRGWYIIKNYNKDKYEEIVNNSIKYLNENKNKMIYV